MVEATPDPQLYTEMQRQNETSRSVPFVGCDLLGLSSTMEERTKRIFVEGIEGYDIVAYETPDNWYWAIFIRTQGQLNIDQKNLIRRKIGEDIPLNFRLKSQRGSIHVGY